MNIIKWYNKNFNFNLLGLMLGAFLIFIPNTLNGLNLNLILPIGVIVTGLEIIGASIVLVSFFQKRKIVKPINIYDDMS